MFITTIIILLVTYIYLWYNIRVLAIKNNSFRVKNKLQIDTFVLTLHSRHSLMFFNYKNNARL